MMRTETSPDLLVLGGGAAGLAAARAAVRFGRRVVMVQDGPVGGDCTFTGCVPSKTLIESAALGLDFDTAMDRIRDAVSSIAATETADRLRAEGIDVVEGIARFTGPGTVRVDARAIRARRIVIATGSSPARPAVPGADTSGVLDTDSFWLMQGRPDSLLVLGGGSTGCELALAMAGFGTRVTIVESSDRLLPGEDADAARVIQGRLTAAGVDVRCGSSVTSLATSGGGTIVAALGDDTVTVNAVLLATGRRARTAELGVQDAGVELDATGNVIVDDSMATTAHGVWAAGDVTGRMLLTHVADEMGRAAATNALRRPLRLKVREDAVPRVTFTDPEVAQVGMTEGQAAGTRARVAYLPMTDVDRAVTAGRTEGFIKLIVQPRVGANALGRLIGATVVAPRAGEMIHELALALRIGMPVFRLAQTVHAYPTWSVAVRSVAAQFLFEVDGRSPRPAESR